MYKMHLGYLLLKFISSQEEYYYKGRFEIKLVQLKSLYLEV